MIMAKIFNLQGWLVDYKVINKNQIALKFYVFEDRDNKPVYAYALCDTKMLNALFKALPFKDFYGDEIDFDKMKEHQHIIGFSAYVNYKNNLIIENFYPAPDYILYDDAISAGILSNEEKVLEKLNLIKPKTKDNQGSKQSSLF